MNKRIILIITIIALLASVISCKAAEDNLQSETAADIPEPTLTPIKEPEPESSREEYVVFGSLEEFDEYLKTAEEGEDIAALGALKRYYIPTGIPENYELYKITAGIVDIGFWYLPKEYLESGGYPIEAEAKQMHYLFISPRYEDDMEILYQQLEISEDKQSEDYYVRESGGTKLLFCQQDDAVMGLYLPAENNAVGEAQPDSIKTPDPADLCRAASVTVE